MEKSLNDEFIESIQNSKEITDKEKNEVIQKYKQSDEKVHLLFLGKTGVGKSSTINSLFDTQKAEVGNLVNSTTKEIIKYKFGDNLIIYDSPGIGEPGKDLDNKIIIKDYLNKKDENGKPLIDLAIFILDACDIALEESINFINEELSPLLGDTKRLIIAFNKINQIYAGSLFNKDENKPTEELKNIMKEKINELKKHLKKEFEIIYYCSGFKYNGFQCYNKKQLIEIIVKNFSIGKRIATFNWEKSKEIAFNCLKYGGLAIGGAALGGIGLLSAWRSYLLAKALLNTLAFEKIALYSNYLYFLSSLIVDGGEDYRKNQEFWNKDVPRAIDGLNEIRNDISKVGNWFKDKFGSNEKQNMDNLYKLYKIHK